MNAVLEEVIFKPTADDRCDRCSARALTKIIKDEMELLLCGHHTDQHEPALIAAGFNIVRSS